jgi:hypothetical protein
MKCLRTKSVKINKPHECHCCGEEIQVGKTTLSETCINDGMIYTVYICRVCDILINKHYKHFVDTMGNYQEGCVKNYCDECHNGISPKELLEKLER